MQDIELVLGLLVAVAALVTIARRLEIPYPILLVIGGLVLGFIPGLPSVELRPDLVFLLFLPPLLYWQALNTSMREFRANLRPIFSLSIGLVLFTIAVVAIVTHAAIAGLSWSAAFVLGAIIAPTDEVAAGAIAERLPLPRRIMTVLEGESLLNDATALVAYSVAVAVALGGSFSPTGAGLLFIEASLGGIAVGLVAGWIIGQIRRYLHDPPVENTISLMSGFAAYLPAQALGVSGVLAVVTTGIYLGRLGPRIISSQTRLQGGQLWAVVVFLLNSLLFILVGLQLHHITLAALSSHSAITLIAYAVLVVLTVILVRVIWVFPASYLPSALSRRIREHDPYPSWKTVTIIAWTGMRGGVSLAAALALTIAFPGRDLIIFLTFCVILATLVVQGLSLPSLIHWVQPPDDGSAGREETKARLKVARAALARLNDLASEDWVPQDILDDLRVHYEEKDQRFTARMDGSEDGSQEERASAHLRVKREVITAQRTKLLELRSKGIIDDEVLRRIQRDLDLEEVRLQP